VTIRNYDFYPVQLALYPPDIGLRAPRALGSMDTHREDVLVLLFLAIPAENLQSMAVVTVMWACF
jgi:hypothetical protein